MTREAKRGTSDSNKKHGFIDEDMLPPSDSDVEEDEECEATDDDDVGDDDDDVEPDEKYVENAGMYSFFKIVVKTNHTKVSRALKKFSLTGTQ